MTKEEARKRLEGRHYFEEEQGLLRISDARLVLRLQAGGAVEMPGSPELVGALAPVLPTG